MIILVMFYNGIQGSILGGARSPNSLEFSFGSLKFLQAAQNRTEHL